MPSFSPQQPRPFKDFTQRAHRHAIDAAAQQNRQAFDAFRAGAHHHVVDFNARQADAQRLRSMQGLPRTREQRCRAVLAFEEFRHKNGSEVIVNDGRTVVIGRPGTPASPESTTGITIADPEVSRTHAELICGRNGLWVRDLRSTNGTFVNGVRIHRRTRLERGDTVSFGPVRASVLAAPEPPAGPARVFVWILVLAAIVAILFVAASR